MLLLYTELNPIGLHTVLRLREVQSRCLIREEGMKLSQVDGNTSVSDQLEVILHWRTVLDIPAWGVFFKFVQKTVGLQEKCLFSPVCSKIFPQG